MQTFLPYASFARSALVLDDKRLGRQRQEALMVLEVLTGARDGGGYAYHPCVRQWSKSVYGLALYTLAICREWQRRGYREALQPKVFRAFTSDIPLRVYDSKAWPVARLKEHALLPWWFGWRAYHESHRRVLLYKKYDHYAPLLDPDRMIPKETLHKTPNIWPHPVLHTYRLTYPEREPLVPMVPTMHFRDPQNVYKGLCGAGYDYPNTTRKTDNPGDVTCSECVMMLVERLH